MEDFKIDIMIEPNARTVQLNLNPFTLIGATTFWTSTALCELVLVFSRLQYYTAELLTTIVERSASILKMPISKAATKRANATYVIFANKGNGTIDIEIAICKGT
jgi:Holliday junction DNA helicase RuvB